MHAITNIKTGTNTVECVRLARDGFYAVLALVDQGASKASCSLVDCL
jgi:hypothetical protein